MRNTIELPLKSSRNICILSFLVLLTMCNNSTAQTSFGIQLVRGEITGYSEVNYEYKPTIIQFESFTSAGRNLDFVVQRQLTFATFADGGLAQKAWEAGLNLGVVLHARLSGLAKIYVLGSTGPHFVSNTPRRQAQGFIFSDNFRTGLLLPLRRPIELDLCAGIRHISNAGLKRPNRGIDNIMVGFGLKYSRPGRRDRTL